MDISSGPQRLETLFGIQSNITIYVTLFSKEKWIMAHVTESELNGFNLPHTFDGVHVAQLILTLNAVYIVMNPYLARAI